MFQTVGIIGAGTMGRGIAQTCAAAGLQVKLLDSEPEALDAARTAIGQRLDRKVKKQAMTAADREAALSRIETGADYALLGPCDLVVEAVTEEEGLKRAVLREVEPHLPERAIIASNTSSLSITRLAANTGRPEQFCGLHFMNPVPAIPLVEIIRGLATSDDTFAKCQTFVEQQLGKTVAVAEDFPGFIVNRVLIPMVNEAVYALYEGVGTIRDIDSALKLGANHPMGPLEVADFIGLDVCLAILNTLYSDLNDAKYRPSPLLVKYVEAGWLGRKTGRGFYDYHGEDPVPTR